MKLFKNLNSRFLLLNSVSNESGQILIIILLILVVAVSIVLSLSARSLTDIRTTTSTEQSNRAYFAAEAGIERALQQIKDDPNVVSGTTITGSTNPLGNQAQYAGVIEVTGGKPEAFAFDALKDQTVQVNLKPNINQATYASNDFGLAQGAGPSLYVYWHVGSSGDVNQAALEISVLRVNSAGNYVIDRFGCDNNHATRPSGENGFSCSGATLTPNQCGTAVVTSNKGSISYCNRVTIPLNNANYKAVLMRIRPLYSNDSLAVKFNGPDLASPSNNDLPQQGYKITSTGSSNEGASRKLEVYRSFPSLPTVFDFVLYNGSSNSLTKP